MFEGGFIVVMFNLMEAIHVELPHKAVNFLVPEVPGQNGFLKLEGIFDDEFLTVGGPVNDLLVFLDLT